MIRDQRHMYGMETVADVEAFWAERAAAHGFPLVEDDRTVEAYVSDGRWVADCPECNDGIACWDQNTRGACMGCGHVYPVSWHLDTDQATGSV
mgnify:CR=1 FL=1